MSPVLKRPREKFTLPSKYLLFLLTLLCIGIMALSFNTNLVNTPLKTIAGYLLVPFQNGIAEVGRWFSDKSDQLLELRDVLDENQRLKEEVDKLTIENTRFQQERYELNELRELLALDKEYSDYEKIGAQVISRDSSNWFSSFVINKGSNDGIKVNCNVMAGSGLVGRVTDVGPNYAKVTSIIEDNNNTSGMLLSTGDHLVVTGDLTMMPEGMIAFGKLVDRSDRAAVGDKIVTSNISDHYLPGILIGYISQIETDANNLTKSGTLTTAVDFEHLQDVLVILELKQTIE
ncbi:MAG: rod shape-determining protein MreC [Lachnospiraceae bacterium]|nr:rod shape-determining protein MreC [Lachnospiraceae bacterium]MDY5700182.1 rod shape-determining protein MreC [Lachnospiraceae bacterium]